MLTAPFIYAARKGNAETSGESLAELVMHLSEKQEVILVGHSLGCRVVLEAVRRIAIARERDQRPGGAHVSSVCLMAAAVPTGECDGREARYRRRSDEPKELVLYSGHDWVLRPGYGLAEWFYDSKDGRAVGATGQPEKRWKDGSVGEDPKDTKLGHTQYWKSKTSAKYVGDFLAGVPIREAADRAGPEQLRREQPGRAQDSREMETRDSGDVRTLKWQNCFDPP